MVSLKFIKKNYTNNFSNYPYLKIQGLIIHLVIRVFKFIHFSPYS